MVKKSLIVLLTLLSLTIIAQEVIVKEYESDILEMRKKIIH